MICDEEAADAKLSHDDMMAMMDGYSEFAKEMNTRSILR